MSSVLTRFIFSLVFLYVSVGCSQEQSDTASKPVENEIVASASNAVDAARIIAADSSSSEWLSHGRTYSEQRFSTLTQIDHNNVANLGLAWYSDLPTRRGIETTPLMADGKLYVTGSWGHVLAYDARTGALLWHFDPKVAKDYGRHACCDVVNRGVALWGSTVLAASLDGKLRALDRDTGEI
ncbi:MAG: quinohemoprotein ethanol dehydrogenase, partial [Candidatus Azotimanducaceae bacterium]